MEITEVRIKLMDEPAERLQAFCSITFDNAFVVRDLKIIEGNKGSFVAMPSRKLTDRCPRCGCKNHLRAQYCNQCGNPLGNDRATKDDHGRAKLHADIAHPIHSPARESIQKHVLEAYQDELSRSKQPGYVSSYEEFDYDDLCDPLSEETAEAKAAREPAPSYREIISRVETKDDTPQGPHRQPAGARRTPQPAKGDAKGDFGAGIL